MVVSCFQDSSRDSGAPSGICVIGGSIEGESRIRLRYLQRYGMCPSAEPRERGE